MGLGIPMTYFKAAVEAEGSVLHGLLLEKLRILMSTSNTSADTCDRRVRCIDPCSGLTAICTLSYRNFTGRGEGVNHVLLENWFYKQLQLPMVSCWKPLAFTTQIKSEIWCFIWGIYGSTSKNNMHYATSLMALRHYTFGHWTLTLWSAEVGLIIVPHRIIWSWYTGRWCVAVTFGRARGLGWAAARPCPSSLYQM